MCLLMSYEVQKKEWFMSENSTKLPFVGSVWQLGVEGKGEGQYILATLGSKLGLERIGVNHETIFPGTGSSIPHCHSRDEEFVFVVSGHPSLWIDGNLHQLKAGDAVAFPAGTGIAHTFLNNTDESIELLIVGEHSPDDKVHYPVNPEIEKLHPRPWKDAPRRPLGLHDGKPDLHGYSEE